MSFSDEIRKAITKSGLTRYRIAAESGVSEATLSRFMSGSSMTTDSLDKIAAVLRLRVEMDGPRQAALKKPRR